jgi:hypothetical protein
MNSIDWLVAGARIPESFTARVRCENKYQDLLTLGTMRHTCGIFCAADLVRDALVAASYSFGRDGHERGDRLSIHYDRSVMIVGKEDTDDMGADW